MNSENISDNEEKLQSTLQLLIRQQEKRISGNVFKSTEEITFLKLLNALEIAIERRRTSRKSMVIPSTIQKLYLSQRLYLGKLNVFSFEDVQEDLIKYEQDFISTAEYWVVYLKSMFTKINKSFEDFLDEKEFWLEMNKELESVHNLSVSEEFVFVMDALRATGNLTLLYTVIVLINDQRVLRLCQKFNDLYRDMDFGCLKKNTKPEDFIAGVLNIITRLSEPRFPGNTKLPRIVRRSICKNLNLLGTRILKEASANFKASYFEVFRRFGQLAENLNAKNEEDHEGSRILIENIRSLKEYNTVLDEIFKISRLCICIEANASSDEQKNEIVDFLKDLLNIGICHFKDAVSRSSFAFESTQSDIIPSLFDQKPFVEFISKKATEFTDQAPTITADIKAHLDRNKSFFDIPLFRIQTRNWVSRMFDSVMKASEKIISNIGQDMCLKDALEIMEIIRVFESLKSISEAVMRDYEIVSLKDLLLKYLCGLEEKLLETHIISEMNGLLHVTLIKEIEQADCVDCISLSADGSLSEIEILSKRISSVIKNIRPGYILINSALKSYREVVSEYKELFLSDEFEDYLNGLIELKWKYFREDNFQKINEFHADLLKKVGSFEDIVSRMGSQIIPEMIGRGEIITSEIIMKVFTDFDYVKIENFIKTRGKKLEWLFSGTVSENAKFVVAPENIAGLTPIAVYESFLRELNIDYCILDYDEKEAFLKMIQNEIDQVQKAKMSLDIDKDDSKGCLEIISDMKKKLDSFRTLKYLKLDGSSFNYESRISNYITEEVENAKLELSKIKNEWFRCINFLDKFKLYKELSDIQSKITWIGHEFPNFVSDKALFSIKALIDDECREISQFKLSTSIEKSEFESLVSKRASIESEASSIKEMMRDFPGDEFSFPAYVDQFRLKITALEHKAGIFNQVFKFYKLPDVNVTLTVQPLNEEYAFYVDRKNYLNKHLDVPIYMNQLNLKVLFAGMERSFDSKLLRRFVSDICEMKKPLSYLEELILHCKQHSYTQCSLRCYLDLFDEAEIKELIEKCKVEKQVLDFVDRKRERILEILPERPFDDIEPAKIILSTYKTDFELVTKFNKYDLHLDQLQSIDDYIEEQENLFRLLSKIQSRIIELSDLSSVDVLCDEYNHIKAQFESFWANAGNMPETVAMVELRSIEKGLNNITCSINSSLDMMRSRSNRLYFVPNNDLIKATSGPKEIEILLTRLFNFTGITVDENKIVGIFSKFKNIEEKVELIESVALDAPVYVIMNAFERSLTETLRSLFYKNIAADPEIPSDTCGVTQIDELVSEFRYFSGLSQKKTYRIERLLEYSKTLPDLLKAFPQLNGENTLMVCDAPYAFEYYPPTDFIFTYLTAKIFSAIRLSKHLCGLILYGPSGTGKTESVKYYCRSIGKPLFVFCCNEKCDFAALKNIVVGCELTGNYICFDEFNRLRDNVMSAITELIFEKKDSLKVFLTMNLGYTGRYELPKTLKSIFGEVLVDHPDIRDIVHYNTNSYQISDLIDMLQMHCSQQPFYDFGLRAVRSIFSIEGREGFIQNAVFFFVAMLQGKDKHVLRDSLKTIYKEESNMLAELDRWFFNLSHEEIFEKALCFKTGLIVFGGPGKSRLIENSHSRCVKNGKSIALFRYNPLNLLLEYDSIFGSSEKINKEWIDSPFMRDLKKSIVESKEAWFVFDGPLMSTWIEDFNSVLDDNRQICLVTGERIKIPFNFRFIFETESLENATPATLTRTFLINVASENCHSHPQISDDEFKCDESSHLLPEQQKARYLVEKHLQNSRVVMLIGEEGIGKRTLVRSLNESEFKMMHGSKISAIQTTLLIIDRFEEASLNLTEQVREFHEYGTIGGVKVDCSKIICCIDGKPGNKQIYSRLLRIPRVEIEGLGCIDKFIYHQLSTFSVHMNTDQISDNARAEQILADFCRFLFTMVDDSSESVGLNDLKHLLKLFDSEHASDSLASHLFFIFELVFNSFSARIKMLAKRFLEKRCGEQVKELNFVPGVGFISRDEKDLFRKSVSFISYLLFKDSNVVIQGPRLCGKHYILETCLKLFDNKKKINLFEWSDHEKIRRLNGIFAEDIVHVIMLLENSDDNLIGKKLLKEMAVIVRIQPANVLDLHKTLCDYTFSESVYNRLPVDQAMPNDSTPLLSSISTETSFNALLDLSLKKCPRFAVFQNTCKALEFFQMIKSLKTKYREEFETRRRFLENGITKISEFAEKASEMKTSIKEQQEMIREKQHRLQELIQILQIEKSKCEKEQHSLEQDQVEISMEVQECEEKKKKVTERLKLAEQILEQSKESISQLTKIHLSEIKGMINPPESIRRTIEFTYLLLENTLKVPEWPVLQGFIKKDDFIQRVLSIKECATDVCEFINQRKDKVVKIENASKTCALLYAWILSVIRRREILDEIAPLKAEIEILETRLNAKRVDLDAKVEKMNGVIAKISEIEASKQRSESENAFSKAMIEKLTEDLRALEDVIFRLEAETDEWKHLKFNDFFIDPIKFINSKPEILLEYCKVLVINRSVLHSDEFSVFRKCNVEISQNNPGLEKAISNALYHRSDLIIKDVDRFDVRIYRLLKDCRNGRGGKVIIQEATEDIFEEDAHRLEYIEKFKIQRISNISSLEFQLLSLLSEANPNFKEIQRIQQTIQEERIRLAEEQDLREYYSRLNMYYASISRLFVDVFTFPLSFNIFKEFVGGSKHVSIDQIISFFKFSFKNKIKAVGRDYQLNDEIDDEQFNTQEMLKYKFDYVFITDFNDVLSDVRATVAIDYEISAGSSENNRIVADLLSESSNKIVLVKNIHFLQHAVKTGTNRFIFAIEKGLVHPLMRECRIVFSDRGISYESVLRKLTVRGYPTEAMDLLKIHAACVSFGLDFTLKEVEQCMRNSSFSADFLKEMIYFGKISVEDRKRIEEYQKEMESKSLIFKL